MTGHILVEYLAEGRVAVAYLKNPGRRNAVSATMWREIASIADRVGGDADLRALIITGDGADIFSAGADISDFDQVRSNQSIASSYDDLLEAACRKVEAIPQPTICAIEGLCVGAGVSLACSCDLRIASETAGFRVPAAKLGLGYDFRGIERFVRIFGGSVTSTLLLSATEVPAPRAYFAGAIHKSVVPGRALAEALSLANSMIELAPLTIRAAKLALRAISRDDQGLRSEAISMANRADGSSDYQEGISAFRDKRRPLFKGS